MAGFATEEIEDGRGLTTALVYDDIGAAKAYLDARGSTAFGLKSDADQKAAMLRATEAAEDAIRPHIEGRSVPVTERQGLLFPAIGAYDSSGRLFEGLLPPDSYRKGIFLLAAEVAAGTFMPRAKRDPTISSQASGRGSISYRGSVPAALASNHPNIWPKIATAIPPL